jgi:hypothetical protein
VYDTQRSTKYQSSTLNQVLTDHRTRPYPETAPEPVVRAPRSDFYRQYRGKPARTTYVNRTPETHVKPAASEATSAEPDPHRTERPTRTALKGRTAPKPLARPGTAVARQDAEG